MSRVTPIKHFLFLGLISIADLLFLPYLNVWSTHGLRVPKVWSTAPISFMLHSLRSDIERSLCMECGTLYWLYIGRQLWVYHGPRLSTNNTIHQVRSYAERSFNTMFTSWATFHGWDEFSKVGRDGSWGEITKVGWDCSWGEFSKVGRDVFWVSRPYSVSTYTFDSYW